MMADVIAEASPVVHLHGRIVDEAGIVADEELAGALRQALAALAGVAKGAGR